MVKQKNMHLVKNTGGEFEERGGLFPWRLGMSSKTFKENPKSRFGKE